MLSQFKKGVLELCVLAVVSKKDRYGYELVSTISRMIEVTEGTIYPLLRRLKQEGLVDTYLRESKEGPSRKYYAITSLGKTRLGEQAKQWSLFSKQVTKLLTKFEADKHA